MGIQLSLERDAFIKGSFYARFSRVIQITFRGDISNSMTLKQFQDMHLCKIPDFSIDFIEWVSHKEND